MIQYGENEVRHLMALKEVNTKEAPEAEMTQEKSSKLSSKINSTLWSSPMTPLFVMTVILSHDDRSKMKFNLSKE
eukprot:UN21522